MESVGNKLKSTREDKGLTLERVGRETNISTRYLEALETENYDVFPSEPYTLGYLRNYSEYLGLDQEEIFSLYRSMKIQDQPVPMDELLRGPSRLPKILAIAGIILGILLLGGGLSYFIMNRPQREQAPVRETRIALEYNLTTDFFERRFYPGDSILVRGETDSYRLLLANIGDVLTINGPRGQAMLDLGQEVILDLSDNGFVRVRIIAGDFVRNDNLSGALLRFELETMPVPVVEPLVPMELSTGREGASVIFASPNPMPFTLQAAFQNYCFFRYEILFEASRPGRTEQYYQRFEEISISAQNGIRIGVSNAQAVRLSVIVAGRVLPFEAGGAGEVVAADLRWLRNEDNTFSLSLIRLE